MRIVGPNGRDQTYTPGGDPSFRTGAGVKEEEKEGWCRVPELEVLVLGCAWKKSPGTGTGLKEECGETGSLTSWRGDVSKGSGSDGDQGAYWYFRAWGGGPHGGIVSR